MVDWFFEQSLNESSGFHLDRQTIIRILELEADEKQIETVPEEGGGQGGKGRGRGRGRGGRMPKLTTSLGKAALPPDWHGDGDTLSIEDEKSASAAAAEDAPLMDMQGLGISNDDLNLFGFPDGGDGAEEPAGTKKRRKLNKPALQA